MNPRFVSVGRNKKEIMDLLYELYEKTKRNHQGNHHYPSNVEIKDSVKVSEDEEVSYIAP